MYFVLKIHLTQVFGRSIINNSQSNSLVVVIVYFVQKLELDEYRVRNTSFTFSCQEEEPRSKSEARLAFSSTTN